MMFRSQPEIGDSVLITSGRFAGFTGRIIDYMSFASVGHTMYAILGDDPVFGEFGTIKSRDEFKLGLECIANYGKEDDE